MSDVDLLKVFAELHHHLVLMENSHASIKGFGNLSGEECITAHFILDTLDKGLKARWEADGSPNPEKLTAHHEHDEDESVFVPRPSPRDAS